MSKGIQGSFFMLIALSVWVFCGMTATSYSDLGTRSQAFLDVVSASTPMSFPLESLEKLPIEPNQNLLALQFKKANSPRNVNEQRMNGYTVGDDLGLYWLGVLSFNLLPTNNPFISISLFYIAFVMVCFSVYRRSLPNSQKNISIFIFTAFIIAMVWSCVFLNWPLIYQGWSSSDFFSHYFQSLAPWQPYTYVLLMPLLGSALNLTLNKMFSSKPPVSKYHHVFDLTIIIIAIAIVFSIRHSAWIFLLPFLIMSFFDLFKFDARKKGISYFLACVAAICLAKNFINSVTDPRYLESYGTSHVTWHTIWCYLDDHNETLQFRESDYAANVYANKISGKSLAYPGKEYEAVLKKDVLETVFAHPLYVIKLYLKKLFARPVFILLSIMSLFLMRKRLSMVDGDERIKINSLLFISFSLLLNRVVEMVSTNNILYSLPSISGEILLSLLLLTLLIKHLRVPRENVPKSVEC